jgi:ribosomal protein L40E
MGKLPEANLEFMQYKICLDCKTKNKITVERCRKCGGTNFRKRDLSPRVKKG